MSRPENDGGFLGRWAKRKQAVQLEAKQEPNISIEPQTQAMVDGKPATLSSEIEQKEEEQLPMPSLDDVLPGGDVSMFLQKHVPDSLRNMALRKAWASDPEISSFIEIAENQWDFNNPDSIPGFSSKLEGIDLKAMVERVFNNVAPPQETELEEMPIEAKMNENELQSALSETDENIIMDTKFKEISGNNPSSERKKQESEIHVAVQNNTVESGVYDVLKKRHGSALPS